MALLVSVSIGTLLNGPISTQSSSQHQLAEEDETAAAAEPGIVLIPSEESGGSQDHLGALNISSPVDVGRSLQTRINDVAAQGGIAIINHPRLFLTLTPSELSRLTGYSGIEICNGFAASAFNDSGDAVDVLDAVDTCRVDAGLDLVWGVAVDDAHHLADLGRGWIMAKALNCDTASMVDSLRRGSFYSSAGASIESIRVARRRLIVVAASEESTITFVGKNGVVLQTTGTPSSRASYRVAGDEGYVRVEVDNPSGKAWTQPMAVDSAGVVYNPYALKGRWFKGSIHCHTTESDGDCTPQQIVDWHTDSGYDFLAITDHNKITIPS